MTDTKLMVQNNSLTSSPPQSSSAHCCPQRALTRHTPPFATSAQNDQRIRSIKIVRPPRRNPPRVEMGVLASVLAGPTSAYGILLTGKLSTGITSLGPSPPAAAMS